MPRSLRVCLTLLVVTAPLQSGSAQTIGFDRVRSLQSRYAPGVIPDRVVLTWSGDPATTQSVSWRTHADVQRSMVQYVVAIDGPEEDFKDDLSTIEGHSIVLPESSERFHSVTMEGLTPSTTYVYRAGDGVDFSEWSHFRTAATEPVPFEFLYVGDSQNDLRSQFSRLIREAYRTAPKTAFVLHAGDLVNNADDTDQWQDWFEATAFIHRTIPAVATPGNHEYASITNSDGSTRRRLSTLWRPTFAFPENGPQGLLESAFWMDYQGVRFVSLNSNTKQKEQARWLESVLEDNPQTWTIVTFHHPIYSAKKGRDNETMRDLWQPVFDRFEVDLVLQGHDHTYARTGLMTWQKTPETAVAAGESTGAETSTDSATGDVATAAEDDFQESAVGTVYVVSVSGPKMYELERRPFMRRAAERTQMFQVVNVRQDRLELKAYTATGALYDSFEIVRTENGPNRLVDHIPDVAERRIPVPVPVTESVE